MVIASGLALPRIIAVVGQYTAEYRVMLVGECFLCRSGRLAEGDCKGVPTGVGFGPAGQAGVVERGWIAGPRDGAVLRHGGSFCWRW